MFFFTPFWPSPWLVFTVFQDLCSLLLCSSLLLWLSPWLPLTFLAFVLCLPSYTSACLCPLTWAWFSISACVALGFWPSDFMRENIMLCISSVLVKSYLQNKNYERTLLQCCQLCSLIHLSFLIWSVAIGRWSGRESGTWEQFNASPPSSLDLRS